MAYIGKLPATQGKDAGPSLKIDDISSNFNGQNTVFNLTVDGTSIDPHINNIQIYLSGVHQLPGSSFSLSGSQVVFTQAPSASLSFHGSIIGDARLMTPDNDTVEPASFTSSTSTSISGSLGANATLIRSLTAASISGSKNAGAISGSFRGELSSSVYLRQVASTISGSIPQALATTSSPTFAAGTITGDLSVGGTLTAQEVHTEFESASILFTSGSTKFGDSADDIHNMTGSLRVSGSSTGEHYIIGNNVGIGTDNPAFDLHIGDNSNSIFGANLGSDGLLIAPVANNVRLIIEGDADASITLVDDGASSNEQAMMLQTDGGFTKFRSLNDDTGGNSDNIIVLNHSNGYVGVGTNAPGNPLHLHSDTYPQLNIDGTDNSGNIGFVLSGSGGRGGMRWNGSNNDVEILREGGGVEISLLDGGGTQFAGNLKIDRTADGGNSVLTIQNSAGAGSTDETAQLVFNHTSNSTLGAKITCPRADNYNASGNQSAKLLFTVNSEGSSKTALEIDQFGTHIYDQNLNKGVFYVDTESTDQDVFFMDTELTSGKAFHVDVDAITTGMIMDLNSNHDDSTTRTLVSIINDSSGATGATPFFVRQDANNRTVAFESARGDLSNDILRMNALGRSSTNNFSFLVTFTDGDDDFQHAMKGDGSLVADGAYDSSGADYAEYFESKDGSAISVGTTVRLDGDKIVSCSIGDTPIGVIRPKNSSATVGNTATFRWAEKYLKDDYGGFQMEQHTITTWDVSGSEDATGGIVTIQHHTDRIPSDVTVPSDAEIISTEEDGSPLMRRKLNPKYTSSLTYVSREDRDEWNIVGLLGQIPVTKGQPTGSQWVKMRDISDTVELWYVK